MTTIDSMTAQSLHEHGEGHSITGEDTTWTVITTQRGEDSSCEEQEHDYPWEHFDPVPLTRLYPHTVTTTVYKTRPAEVDA